MALTDYLSETDFYSVSGLTSSDLDNPDYVTFLIDKVNAQIDQQLSKLFCLTPLTDPIRYYMKNSRATIVVNAWQEAGVVDSITITNGGSGYTSAPSVSFSGGDGAGAEAEAVISGGAVTTINITNQGRNYTSVPTISFSGGGGSGAAATATISDLEIVLGEDDGTTETLTIEKDFRLILYKEHEPFRTYPFDMVHIYEGLLTRGSYIEITGTYGFSPQVPDEILLDVQLYEILKKAVLSAESDTDSGGLGDIAATKIDKISVNFQTAGGDASGSKMSVKEALSSTMSLIQSVATIYQVDSSLVPSDLG